MISAYYGWNYQSVILLDNTMKITDVYPNSTDGHGTYRGEVNIKFDGTMIVQEVYGHKFDIYKQSSSMANDNLYGKKMWCNGDSIMAGAKGKSFAHQIAMEHAMNYTNTAVSGTTLAKQDGKTNSILERMNITDSDDYNFVLIEGGYNDYFKKISLGELTDTYTDTFDDYTVIGATESICKYCKTNFKKTKVLFVLGHRASEIGKVEKTFDFYWDAIESALNKWSIPYVDIRKEGKLAAFDNTWLLTYFGSGETMGTHPNTLGYKMFYVPSVESKLQSL